MVDKDLIEVTSRARYYRDGVWKIWLGAVASLVINGMLIVFVGYITTHPPPPVYFPTSYDGRITPLYPLDAPNQSDASVLQWASEAAVDMFTYNYVNWRSELEAGSNFFTDKGWNTFINFLKQSNLIETIVNNKLVVTAEPTLAPYFSRRGILNNRYAWSVQMPLMVTFQSQEKLSHKSYMISMLITRVPSSTSPSGIAIEQFVVSSITGGDSMT